jgi:hypothetical protein
MTYSPYRGSLTAAAIDMRRQWSGGAASHRPHGVSAPGRLVRRAQATAERVHRT